MAMLTGQQDRWWSKQEEGKGQGTVPQRSYSRGKRCLRERQETRSVRKARQLTIRMCIFVQNTAKIFYHFTFFFYIFISPPPAPGSQSDQNCIKIWLQHVLLFLTSVLMHLTPPWHLTQRCLPLTSRTSCSCHLILLFLNLFCRFLLICLSFCIFKSPELTLQTPFLSIFYSF